MKKIDGYYMTWEEARGMLRNALDDNTIELCYDADSYWAYSESNNVTYDMGQIDMRLSEEIGLAPGDDSDRYVGFVSFLGIIIVDCNRIEQ